MHGARTGRLLPDGTAEDVYHVVLESLMREQGYICAYCMRRIPEKRGHPQSTIEHIKPQSKCSAEEKLDYKNMLAVCSGNRNASSDDLKTCDARRGNQDLSLNPLKPDTIATIKYRANGRIYSDIRSIDDELNKVLNLNCEARALINLRKSALNALQKTIRAKGWEGNKTQYRYLLDEYQQSGQKKEYVGILINWLQKHI
jgi:uncharacterized protein (TIGR02646 family)